jgi:Fe-S-cluster containining protein
MKHTAPPEMCKKCAQCCRNFPFVEVSAQEIRTLERETALHAEVFTNAKGAVVDGYFLQFKQNGDCFFLHEKNGGFSCTVYTARPGICQKYPSLPAEKETCWHHRQQQLL